MEHQQRSARYPRWSPFKVSLRRLSGGRQEGSALIEIDTGAMQLTVVPTRGMNVLRAQVGALRLGWDSPVSEVVNPAFVNLESRGGLGWLEGFNELVARCGFEWLGHPGEDRGELLTLHGRASYLPAHTVVLSIDERAPHRISLKGVLNEQAFKKVDFRIDTELTTEPGATAFTLHDRLTNQSDQPGEYQVLYHSNFGAPLLEEGPALQYRCVKFPHSMRERSRNSPIGRHSAALQPDMARRCTTSTPSVMAPGRAWQFCMTNAHSEASHWPSTSNSCQYFPYGRIPTVKLPAMSRVWSQAPASPITAVCNATSAWSPRLKPAVRAISFFITDYFLVQQPCARHCMTLQHCNMVIRLRSGRHHWHRSISARAWPVLKATQLRNTQQSSCEPLLCLVKTKHR